MPPMDIGVVIDGSDVLRHESLQRPPMTLSLAVFG
jgi:hypothetical protein